MEHKAVRGNPLTHLWLCSGRLVAAMEIESKKSTNTLTANLAHPDFIRSIELSIHDLANRSKGQRPQIASPGNHPLHTNFPPNSLGILSP